MSVPLAIKQEAEGSTLQGTCVHINTRGFAAPLA